MRHILRGALFAAVVSLACSLLWAALPFTDAFGSADGTVLTTHNAAWAMNTGTAGIYSSAVISTTAGTLFLARVTGETFSDDQYAQCVLRNPVNNYAMAVAVRVHPSAITNYHVYFDSNELVLRKTVTGTNTTLATAGATTMNDGDVIRLEVVGSDLDVYLNGSGTPTLSATDTAITTGVPGLRGFDYSAPGSAQNRCDDFEAGNTSGSGSPARKRAPVPMMFGFMMGGK